MINKLFYFFSILLLMGSIQSCSYKRAKQAEEQIIAADTDNKASPDDSTINSVSGNITMKQISTYPNEVILTGINNHRLLSIYKTRQKPGTRENIISKFSYGSEKEGVESYERFMPGIDVLFGYNLLNIAHYNLKTDKGNFLFAHPVLIKTLYYPSFIQDSLDKKPINRNYYLVSVYDEDTNKDTLINKKDLRRLYCFDSTGVTKTQIIPKDYSVIRSQYDSKNDAMYIFARHDDNKNGAQDDAEPIHVFWLNLKSPDKAKLMY
ncbi:MAG TPA: hypothetical protein VKG26_02585 [Bacteroidia bacterium]|nr:hypothetical protein [Bacteroidia bacterium]